jgi:diacylglycerol kinase family enzyme
MTGTRPAASRRLAAIAAVGCLAGALVAVGFAVTWGDAWRLPVVLVAAAIAVIGLWYGVSRRGLTSWLGVAAAAIALVTVVVVVLTADYRGLPFALAIVLILVSAGAARYGLGRDRRTLRGRVQSGESLPRPAHPVLIMNPKSGGGKAERFHLVEACRARGIEPVVLGAGDDLARLAVDALDRGADVVGMAGGDGSQALVATLAAARDVPHVCVPAGTRNHFALDLGLDREDVVGALDAFFDGVERRVDLARVNGRVFVNNACMGLYARIVQSEEYRDAKLKTAAGMLPEMLGPDASPFDLRFDGPDGVELESAHLLLVSNNPYELDHLAGHGTRARMDLGTLGLVSARINGAKDAMTFVSLEAAGRIRSFHGWLEWDAPRIRVDSGTAVEIAIDGEAMLMEAPLIFESLPGALRVRLPRQASGVAPAATSVQLTPSSIKDLFRVAAGQTGPESR